MRSPARFRLTPRAALLALLGLGAAPLPGQIPGPPTEIEAFRQRRSQFQIQVLAQSQKLTEQYERALARLEAELAEAGDYEQAREVKKRREQLQALYASGNGLAVENTAIPLPVAQAKGTGVSLMNEDTLTGWRSASHFAEWSGVRLTPGEYYLEFDYLMLEAPRVGAAGVVSADPIVLLEFFEVSLLAGAAEVPRSFELRLSRNNNAPPAPMRIGPVRFTRTPVTLRLSATRSHPGNVILLKNPRLVPAPALVADSPPAAPATPPPSPASDIAVVKEALAAALTAAYQPVLEAQISRLRELALRQPDWQPFIDAELRVLERRLAGTDKRKNTRAESLPLPKPIATLGGISGFQDIEGATFVPHPDNTGDRFRVRFQDQECFIRLLWLRCAPPAEPGEAGGESAFSRHFGIAAEDAALFGRAAREFTSGYLEGKTFRILARGAADADGTLPALVFLDDIGLYHWVLIDQGLAAVIGKPGSGGTLERAFLRSLLDREAEARRREPRPGAWALSQPPSPPSQP